MLGARQSLSLVQAAWQAVAPLHAKGAQAIFEAAWQLPAPSHVRACVSIEVPAGQAGAAHSVPAAKRRHEPLPSQTPSVSQLAAPLFWQVLCGSAAPFATFVHAPRLPASPHDWQLPLQAELQQKPWAQNLVTHSLLSAQDLPTLLRPHEPMMQEPGGVQSASIAQVLLQTFALPQRNGKQELGLGVTQAPLPSHVEAGVKVVVESGQTEPLHDVPCAYF
jgi:hypothetical protein